MQLCHDRVPDSGQMQSMQAVVNDLRINFMAWCQIDQSANAVNPGLFLCGDGQPVVAPHCLT